MRYKNQLYKADSHAAARSWLQIHFAQQSVVARVGAEGISPGMDLEMEEHAVLLVDRLP